MKRPTMLSEAILAQASMDLDLSVERDVSTLRHRFKHEGLSFLTITLPILSDALEQGIENGRFSCPTQFSRHGRLPRFLGGFFKRVFELSGELLQSPDAECIFYIRQICRFFKKLRIECTDRRKSAAISQYLAIEGELQLMEDSILRKDNYLEEISRIIWPRIFSEVDPDNLLCHHGPGVTADRRLSNERHRFTDWYDRWEFTYPADLHAYPNFGYAEEGSRSKSGQEFGLRFRSITEEIPVRVVFVPKTLTAPRVIAIEPSPMQYVQQSLKDYIVEKLEKHRFTKRSIRFSDQTVNQRLAHSCSIDRSLATIDLKDASDRVHFELVRRVFKGSGIADYLDDARSLHATLPDGTNVVLRKYASMGSALCFPVEAMIFYTLIQACMHSFDGIRPSGPSIQRFSSLIDIYGDDIIIPVRYTDAVMAYLESYGLKVNKHKSFRNSLFRESCGSDFFNGTSVLPIYAREIPPDLPSQWTPKSMMSWASVSDQFYLAGQWTIAQCIRDWMCSEIRHPIPRSSILRPGLAFFSYLFTTNLRFNAANCGWEQKRIQFQPVKIKDEIDGDAISCLSKWGISSQRSISRNPIRSIGSKRTETLARAGESLDAEAYPRGRTALSGISRSYNPVRSKYMLGIRPMVPICPRAYSHSRTIADGVQEVILDFNTSVKRGVFKSKRRWIMIYS